MSYMFVLSIDTPYFCLAVLSQHISFRCLKRTFRLAVCLLTGVVAPARVFAIPWAMWPSQISVGPSWLYRSGFNYDDRDADDDNDDDDDDEEDSWDCDDYDDDDDDDDGDGDGDGDDNGDGDEVQKHSKTARASMDSLCHP